MPRERELGVHQNARNHFAVQYDPQTAGNIDGRKRGYHDRALYKADKADCFLFLTKSKLDLPEKDDKIKGDPLKTLFVGRLDATVVEKDLKCPFNKYGDIKRLRLVKNSKTGSSKCYAFVEFKRLVSFKRAYKVKKFNKLFQRANGTLIKGKKILVDFERERIMRGWKPRRLGGGLGGSKKSGQMRFGCRAHPFLGRKASKR